MWNPAGYVSSQHQQHLCPDCITQAERDELEPEASAAYGYSIHVWPPIFPDESLDYRPTCERCHEPLDVQLTGYGERYEQDQRERLTT